MIASLEVLLRLQMSNMLKSLLPKDRFVECSLYLNPGQTKSQVVASGHKLNLRGGLRWVAKRTRKFSHKYMQVSKKHFKADISCISLANNALMDVTQLELTWVGWPNGENLASTCVQI